MTPLHSFALAIALCGLLVLPAQSRRRRARAALRRGAAQPAYAEPGQPPTVQAWRGKAASGVGAAGLHRLGRLQRRHPGGRGRQLQARRRHRRPAGAHRRDLVQEQGALLVHHREGLAAAGHRRLRAERARSRRCAAPTSWRRSSSRARTCTTRRATTAPRARPSIASACSRSTVSGCAIDVRERDAGEDDADHAVRRRATCRRPTSSSGARPACGTSTA